MGKSHKDVEYAVNDASGHQKIFKTFDEAAGFAVSIAVSGTPDVNLDVLVYSEAGAQRIAGDDGLEEYQEDPDASVFERLEIRVNSVGRVP
jgi:hypothetical protein